MKFKKIKKGKKYKLELLCVRLQKNYFIFETPSGDFVALRASDLECICHENGTKNTESAPKYDPCRLFRKGDKVRIKKENLYGRPVFTDHMDFQVGNVYLVAEDETEYGSVTLVSENGNIETYSYLEIELVTMVEEEGLYFIRNNKVGKKFEVRDRKRLQIAATFCYSKTCAHTQNAAQKSALEYCNKLNEGHRKELE